MKLLLIFIIVLVVAVGAIANFTINKTPEQIDTADIVDVGGKAEFNVETAVTSEQKGRGLSGRERIADHEGLLFVFQYPGRYGFWMKDMNFAIDIIWIDENKKVVDITENALPASYHPPMEMFSPVHPALYVLEINAGLARKYGIEVGDDVIMSIN